MTTELAQSLVDYELSVIDLEIMIDRLFESDVVDESDTTEAAVESHRSIATPPPARQTAPAVTSYVCGQPVVVTGDSITITFADFSIDAYDLFLRVKKIPEYQVSFDPLASSYTITAPSRFAGLIDVSIVPPEQSELPFSPMLFDDQLDIVKMALAAKRFAIWSDCGLGKTIDGLEFARHVVHRTGGRVLIVTLNEIVRQWQEEADKFYGGALQIHRIGTRQEMREWCKLEGPGIGITNYEKWNPEDLEHQVVTEAKHLSGIVLDESSRLKTGGGKQKWAIIKSCRGIEYKLSLTATPAPNDVMEFASQASFLEKMRSEGEILWTFFNRHPKTHRWTVRPHARAAFFEFMSSWSIYVRDPRKYGWRLSMEPPPKPETIVHELQATDEQLRWIQKLAVSKDGQMALFDNDEKNAILRNRLSQVAKGFIYRKKAESSTRIVKPVESLKPQFVADLIRSEVAAGLQVIVWTIFDAESEILEKLLGDSIDFDVLKGKTPDDERVASLDRFRAGESRVLISLASMLGYGMNLQCCGSMIFSGFNDSYESYYQAIRRAYRHGQTKSVRVHLPCIPDLEGDMLENLYRKQADHESAIAVMEENYVNTMKGI